MAYRQLWAEKPKLRIALVGKTGMGKSESGNTIMGRQVFKSQLSSSSVTSKSQKKTVNVDGQTVAVVDTPGLFDTPKKMDEVKKQIAKGISLVAPGPHVFLIVIKPGVFTREEEETVKILQKIFGEKARKYTMALFTHGDILKVKNVSIEILIEQNQSLSNFITQCGGGYHVFDNQDMHDHHQVPELLEKINSLVEKNGGSYFTNDMFKEAEKAREEQERLLRENPTMDPKEARIIAEKDKFFIQSVQKGATAGAAIGALPGAMVAAVGGAAVGAVGGILGGAVGVVGAGVLAVKKKACKIQ